MNIVQPGAAKLYVEGAGLAVHWRGSDEPTVVFISGLGDTADVWTPVVDRLHAFVRCLTYDRAGCGSSDDLPAQLAATARPSSWAAEQLRALLGVAGVAGPVVLVGHSLGGQIADAFATRWPAMVNGLVLADAVDPELNLRISPPRPVLDDAVTNRAGHGWRWDVAASAREYASPAPTVHPPTAVVASAIWRWFQAKDPERYRPLSLAEVDQRWQMAQLAYAVRWCGDLVVAHDAGHRLHQEAPDLLVSTISAVVDAAASGTALRLDRERIRQAGGSVRPTSVAG